MGRPPLMRLEAALVDNYDHHGLIELCRYFRVEHTGPNAKPSVLARDLVSGCLRSDQFAEMERLMNEYPVDFIQVNYSVIGREAEKRLLPLAQEKDIAVMVNLPFYRGRLFTAVADRAVPAWAADFDCSSWAQFFLKFVVSHPAVTCAIPGITKIESP